MFTPNFSFKKLRYDKRLTQKELATLTKINRSKLSFFEQGYERPNEDETRRLAKALRVQPFDIEKHFKE